VRLKDREKINQAIANGLSRKIGEPAKPDQTLTYILSDKKFYHHANLISAKAEKEFLETALARQVRLYKVWNTNREYIEADMKLIRSELKNSSNWCGFQQAIDRILTGAGY